MQRREASELPAFGKHSTCLGLVGLDCQCSVLHGVLGTCSFLSVAF